MLPYNILRMYYTLVSMIYHGFFPLSFAVTFQPLKDHHQAWNV